MSTPPSTIPPPVPGNAPYQLLLDEVGAFVYTTDLAGRYTYANQLVLDLLGPGLRLADVIGRAFTDFVQIDEDTELRETDRRVLEHGETIHREEVNFIHATGELRAYWTIKKPLRDAAGTIIGMLGISHDITEKKRLEDEVRRQKELLDSVLDNVDALVYMKGADRRFVYANQSMAKAFGRPVAAIIGARDVELLPREAADRFWQKDQQILATGKHFVGEETIHDASGRAHHYWSVAVRATGPTGQPAVIGLSTDITELHDLKEELQRQARIDGLTGIANRRTFFARAEEAFARSRAHALPLSLLALDLDHFKHINDTHGHPVGDQVLRAYAERCAACLPASALLARTGGEEFGILLPGMPLDQAHHIAACAGALDAGIALADGATITITASIGLVALTPADASFAALFARADRALYAAKAQGRNCVVVA